jgi:hypothetical protein
MLFTAMLFLLAGALATVALAWASAAWVRLGLAADTAWQEDRNLPARGWMLFRFEAFGATRVVAMARSPRDSREAQGVPADIVPSWCGLVHAAMRQSADARAGASIHPGVMYDDARGWPMRALWYRWDSGGGVVAFSGGIALPPAEPDPPGALNTWNQRALALRPWWPGLAVDLLFWAALLWLLIRGPFALRRFLRLKRGLCPHCAYPMGQSPVCSECGRPLPAKLPA